MRKHRHTLWRFLTAALVIPALPVLFHALAEVSGASEVFAVGLPEAVEELGELDLYAPEICADDAEDANDGLPGPEVMATMPSSPFLIRFPDSQFRVYIYENFCPDTGMMTDAECMTVRSINVPDFGIGDLTGIDVFKRLEALICSRNRIKSLDLRGVGSLEILDCSENRGLKELFLDRQDALRYLDASGTALSAIDISGCGGLIYLLKDKPAVDDSGIVRWSNGSGNCLTIDGRTALTRGSETLFSPLAVQITEDRFPAQAFRKYVREHCDTSGDGWLSEDEILAVTDITLRDMKDYFSSSTGLDCPDLTGIGYFTRLRSLTCVGCGIAALDVSGNRNLKTLICDFNELKKLDVTDNPALTRLSCAYNHLKKLDIRGNEKLKELDCSGNRLKTLDLSGNRKLTALDCTGNWLKTLDLGRNRKLMTLGCSNNALTALKTGKNTKLKTLSCAGNRLKALDLSKNTKLTALDCAANGLKKLDLSNNTKLTTLKACDNRLRRIDIGKCPGLRKALKMTKEALYSGEGTVTWGKWVSDYYEYFEVHLSIDRKTRLTSGSKVLYRGK